MITKTTLGAASLAALALAAAACNQTRMQPNGTFEVSGSKYCTPFRANAPNAPGAAAYDPQAAFEDCAHRWGYALAPGRDQAEVVAQAVVDACSAQLAQWNQQALSQTPGGAPTAPSLTTGQPTDLMTDHAQYAQGRALFYVVQARAGSCPAPPPQQMVQNGAPG